MIQTMSIPTFARHTITVHREEIKEQYGVSLYFPKNEILPNNHQAMKMDGSTRSIQQVRNVVFDIVGKAKSEHDAYKQRRSARRKYEANVRDYLKDSEEEVQKMKPITKNTAKNKNPFGALMDEDEDEDGFQKVSKKSKKANQQITETVDEFPQLNGSVPQLQSNVVWGAGMYKPEPIPEPEPMMSKPISTAWGDVSDDEE